MGYSGWGVRALSSRVPQDPVHAFSRDRGAEASADSWPASTDFPGRTHLPAIINGLPHGSFPESPILADGLFLYGTLRLGGVHHAWLERTHPVGSTRAWVPGRLFHLPQAGYPALVPGPEPETPPPGPGWVAGEFVGYEDEADLQDALSDLDQLKGVEEELFLRSLLPVVLEGGQRMETWAYIFPEDRLPTLERHAVELADGDWEPYLGDGLL